MRDPDLSKSERRISAAPCYRRARGEAAASWNEPWASRAECLGPALQGSASPHKPFAAAAERPSWAGAEPRVSRGGLRCERQKPRPRLSPSAARPRCGGGDTGSSLLPARPARPRRDPAPPGAALWQSALLRLSWHRPKRHQHCPNCSSTIPVLFQSVPGLSQGSSRLYRHCPRCFSTVSNGARAVPV